MAGNGCHLQTRDRRENFRERMSFFNSLSIRIPLALIGGILYGLLTYTLVKLIALPSELAPLASVFVFLFYIGSRLLILISGIESTYYSKRGRIVSRQIDEKSSFYQTTQWVGKFYHYHDIALFVFLTGIAIVFLISLMMDGSGNKPLGSTIQNLWNAIFLMP